MARCERLRTNTSINSDARPACHASSADPPVINLFSSTLHWSLLRFPGLAREVATAPELVGRKILIDPDHMATIEKIGIIVACCFGDAVER